MNRVDKSSKNILKIDCVNCESLLNKGLRLYVDYQEYEADKRKRLGEEGAKPKRIRYKPITR